VIAELLFALALGFGTHAMGQVRGGYSWRAPVVAAVMTAVIFTITDLSLILL
jgi:hypothetical protein